MTRPFIGLILGFTLTGCSLHNLRENTEAVPEEEPIIVPASSEIPHDNDTNVLAPGAQPNDSRAEEDIRTTLQTTRAQFRAAQQEHERLLDEHETVLNRLMRAEELLSKARELLSSQKAELGKANERADAQKKVAEERDRIISRISDELTTEQDRTAKLQAQFDTQKTAHESEMAEMAKMLDELIAEHEGLATKE